MESEPCRNMTNVDYKIIITYRSIAFFVLDPSGDISETILYYILKKYSNYFVAGDLNINFLDPKCNGDCQFSDLKDTFNLVN